MSVFQVTEGLLADAAVGREMWDRAHFVMSHSSDEVQLNDLLTLGSATRVLRWTGGRNPAYIVESRSGRHVGWWDVLGWHAVMDGWLS